mmetsp:Transcript_20323/g.27481  ORF Transcript_20323/g.27481 Transcript_20323/m.27481 type:complete len:81 (+) Transcript_20323:1618-1860(+)
MAAILFLKEESLGVDCDKFNLPDFAGLLGLLGLPGLFLGDSFSMIESIPNESWLLTISGLVMLTLASESAPMVFLAGVRS